VMGGKRIDRPGSFMQPTILTNIKPGNPAFRIGVNLSFGRVATFFHFLNARENQGVFIFQRPFPLLAFLEVDRLG